jgi:hypothetical protein
MTGMLQTILCRWQSQTLDATVIDRTDGFCAKCVTQSHLARLAAPPSSGALKTSKDPVVERAARCCEAQKTE